MADVSPLVLLIECISMFSTIKHQFVASMRTSVTLFKYLRSNLGIFTYFSNASPQLVTALDTFGTSTLLHFSISFRSGFSECRTTPINWEICSPYRCIPIFTMFLDCCTAGFVSSTSSSDIRMVVLQTPEIQGYPQRMQLQRRPKTPQIKQIYSCVGLYFLSDTCRHL